MSPAEEVETGQDDFDFIEFEQNDLLRDLCGTHDTNLLLIEKHFGMRIDMRGNRLVLSGGEGARAQAKAILSELYTRLEG